MTASQRPERVDRDALIEAAKEVAQSRGWIMEWSITAAMVDAILPLIADAIHAELRDTVKPHHSDLCQEYGVGMLAAEVLVRSLGGEQ